LVQRAWRADFYLVIAERFGGVVSEMEFESIFWRRREHCENFWKNQFRRGF